MITVKEEFLTEEKTKRAIKLGGYEAIGMWLALKGYVARKNTGGFVPDEAIDDLQGAPPRPRKLLQNLIDCGMLRDDGTRGAGLVDPAPHGWKLHDYEDHGTDPEVERLRREKQRDRKRRWRLNRPGSERGTEAGQDDVTSRGTSHGTEAGQREGPEGGTETGTETRDSRARVAAPSAHARSQPSPAQPEQQLQPQTNGTKVPCPPDLTLTEDQRANLTLGMGIDGPAIDAVTVQFRGSYLGKPEEKRTMEAWRAGLNKAVCQDGKRVQRELRDAAREGGNGHAEELPFEVD